MTTAAATGDKMMLWCIALLSLLSRVIGENFHVEFPSWESIIDPRIIQAHRFVAERAEDWTFSLMGDEFLPSVACYWDDDPLLDDTTVRKEVIFVDKVARTACFLVQAPKSDSPHAKNSKPLPSALKIDASLLNHLNGHSKWQREGAKRQLEESSKPLVPLTLQVLFSPLALESQSSSDLLDSLRKRIRDYVQRVVHTVERKVQSIEHAVLPAVRSLLHHLGVETDPQVNPLESALRELSKPHCDILVSPNLSEDGFEVSDAHTINPSCLLSTAIAVAASGSVISLSLVPTPTLMNYEARGHLQCGREGGEPYTANGLTGAGQIIGIADSGLDDSSCFFIDDSKSYPTIATSREGTVEPFRRKVIQYVPFADAIDELGGHGTHVAGSVAGSSINDFPHMNGVAPDAKIAFFDIGLTDKALLKVPALYKLLKTGYDAGARVHTNSWGNDGGLYGAMSRDVDKFTCDHDDMIILFAGGNSGAMGRRTIISPGNAKNALTIGAGQIRSVFNDNERTNSDMSVALFSSIGPTFDNRIKPDVIAPGDFIMSAYAAAPHNQSLAMDPLWEGHDHCATHQMSGTSMATPLTAGAVLLARQYFMDRRFWASLCPADLSTCQQGPFTPSGVLLKTVFLHSAVAVMRYSDPDYDIDGSVYRSFPLSAPPDNFQGYGQVVLKNVLPLANGQGLKQSLQLFLWDRLQLSRQTAMEFTVRLDKRGLKKVETIDGNVQWVSKYPLKATIAWYDRPHAVGFMSKLLLQDLDLFVVTPHQRIFLGNKRNATYSEEEITTRKVVADDRNPNEQVYIGEPVCFAGVQSLKGAGDCTFTVLVAANALPAKAIQSFAIVITANGTVDEPNMVQDAPSLFPFTSTAASSEEDESTASLLATALSISAQLAGGEAANSTIFVDHCAVLDTLRIQLNFLGDAAVDSWPYNLELTVVDPLGRGLAIGGMDTSLGKAEISTEWPDHWMRHRNGSFSAELAIRDAGLAGDGWWTVYLLNSWSPAGRAQFDVSVEMHFDSEAWNNDTVCSLLALSPSPRPTAAVLEVSDEVRDKDFKGLTSQQLPFSRVKLGVRDGEGESDWEHDIVQIGSIEQEGLLDSIVLSLDAGNATMRGSNAWLLTVIVTAPNGLVAQVGGVDWIGVEDRFYVRRWPDPWIGRSTRQNWVSKRDLHAAGLVSLPLLAPLPSFAKSKGKSCSTTWTVSLAMGYPFGARDRVAYTGSVTLFFRPIFGASPSSATPPFGMIAAGVAIILAVVVSALLCTRSMHPLRKAWKASSRIYRGWRDIVLPTTADEKESDDEERQPLQQRYGAI